MVSAFAVLVIATLFYAVWRLTQEPQTGLDQRSTRLARILLIPRLFNPLVARPLVRREIIGVIVLLVLMLVALKLF
jgi:hypothetical protein